MVPALDIFRVEPDGHLVWCSAADDLDAARRRVRILMASQPADYVIYNQQSAAKIIVRAGDAAALASGSSLH